MSKAANQNQRQNYQEMALQGATQSVREVYSIISEYDKISAKEIIAKVRYSSRTVRYALKVLLDLQLILKVPNLTDCRVSVYRIYETI